MPSEPAREPLAAVGWDIGGVNVKAAGVVWRDGVAGLSRSVVRPFEVWRARDDLPRVLAEVGEELGIAPRAPMAVTMTAELSDTFATKREGVVCVAESVRSTFPDHELFAVDVFGAVVAFGEVFARPLDFAATNWIASAQLVAARHPDCILVDIGSTTTDIVPIRNGHIDSEGRTDLARLQSGELVYTGLLRTDPATLVDAVPVRGRPTRVSSERFSLMADAHLVLGALTEDHYTCPTADGQGTSRRECEDRLARLVCADRESLDAGDVVVIARSLVERQVQVIADGLLQVVSRLGDVRGMAVLPAGVGASLAAAAAGRAGLPVLDAASGGDALPAFAAAALLARRLEERR